MTTTQNPKSKIQNPKLVFVHGAGSNRDFWHEQRAAFPHAHYLNLPGHTQARGHPAATESMNSIEQYADWVAHYVEDLGLKRVILNGHSMGGAITLTLALRRPPWLSAIALTSTGARSLVPPQLLELLRTDYPAAITFITDRSFAHTSKDLTYAQRARINSMRRQLLRTPQQVTLQDYEACAPFNITSRLPEIDLPTLCLVGAQDKITPPSYTQYLRNHIKPSTLHIIQQAGHMLPLEQPKEYNQALTEFAHETKA